MSVRTPRSVIALAVPLLILAGCGGGSSKAPTAQPGDASKADRTVEIQTSDSLKFDPATVSVKRGETVAFHVVNNGKIDHEFDVGDAAFQDAHEKEMRAMPAGMSMSDEPTSVDLPAGQSKTVTLTFPTSGTLLYGCHEAGHYPAGMKGEIKIT